MEFQKIERKKEPVTPSVEERLKNWPKSYYRERESAERMKLLDAADAAGLTGEENAYRRDLFMRRYGKAGSGRDAFLQAWLDFKFLAQNGTGFFSKKGSRRKAVKLLENMGFSAAEEDSAARALLEKEIYHLGRVYIAACLEDKGYNAVLFGLGRISDEQQVRKIAADFRVQLYEVPKALELTAEMALWRDVLKTAFTDTFPDYAELVERDAANG